MNAAPHHTMPHPRSQHGFTLLEVLLAVALASALLGGLFVFHRQVLAMRTEVIAKTEMLAAERILMDRLTAELRGALPTSHFGLVFEGSDTRMVFHYVDVPRFRQSSDGLIAPQSDVRRLTYRLLTEESPDDSRDAERGEVGMAAAGDDSIVLGVERFAQDVLPVPLEEEDDEGDEVGARSLFDQFRFLSLRYWTGDAWVYQWFDDTLPAAVEVTLGLEPLPNGVDPAEYPYETFRRIIALPAATLSTDRVRRQPLFESGDAGEDDDFFFGEEE